MKNLLTVLLLSATTIASNAQNWKLTGQVTEAADEVSAIYLYQTNTDGEKKMIDSALVKNAQFQFERQNTTKEDEVYTIEYKTQTAAGTALMMIKNGDAMQLTMADMYNSTFSGSPASALLNKYAATKQKEVDQIMALTIIYMDTTLTEEDKMKKMETFRVQSAQLEAEKIAMIQDIAYPAFNAYIVLDEIRTLSIIDKNSITKISTALTPEGAKTASGKRVVYIQEFVDAYILERQSSGAEYEEVKARYDALDNQNKASEFGIIIAEKLKKLELLGIGKPAPAFSGKTLDGTAFNLKYINKKVIVIDFWASWCGPCRLENKHYKVLNETFKDQDFALIAYSLDTKKENWKAASLKDGVTWMNVSNLKATDKDPICNDYQVFAIPANIVIVEGKIVARNIFGEELENTIIQYLEK